ncbi:MAG TPA: four helix bundle protein [Chloroflexota bacterium]|nr:four helix bundle protein [Chloroflexota bacterium]HUM68611.1 four helix bundle protein [Chloroflexota bacterium]
MKELGYARSFRDLVAYQLARECAQDIFDLTRNFPKEEAYSLTDQVRRSSRSVGAQIAEAWAKRRYEKHFISKLTDADGEQQETQHWLETAVDCGYLTQEQARLPIQKCERIGSLIGGMINKSAAFCQPGPTTLREESAPYFTNHE